jgi:hypothetical protein
MPGIQRRHSVGMSKTMLCHREHTRDKVKSPVFARRSSSVHSWASALAENPTSEEVSYENISTKISAGKRRMVAKLHGRCSSNTNAELAAEIGVEADSSSPAPEPFWEAGLVI